MDLTDRPPATPPRPPARTVPAVPAVPVPDMPAVPVPDVPAVPTCVRGTGPATDLAVLVHHGATLHDHGDHVVAVQPGHPWANRLVVADPGSVDDATRWVQRHRQTFPALVTTRFVLAAVPSPRALAAWARLGVQVSPRTTLVCTQVPHASVPLPPGCAVTALTGADDFARLSRRAVERHRLEDQPSAPRLHADLTRRWDRRRFTTVADGHAAWFAVVEDDRVVASLGVVRCGPVGRLQALDTDPEHRRRGLAGQLLTAAGAWALFHGCTVVVGTAPPGSPAHGALLAAGFGDSGQDPYAWALG